MEFTAYSLEHYKIINVAGGGLSNGNAYAEIDIKYKEDESGCWFENIIAVYYKEYGKYPICRLIGDDIEWDDEPDTFKVLKDGKYVEYI
jgi:hypothetical protein